MNEPLVLLPDIMCDARIFAPQIAALSKDRAVTVAPITGGDRIEEMASNLLDVLPRRFALAGVGLGASVAMELLRRAPDRVTRIGLMNASATAHTPQSAADLEPIITKAKVSDVDGFCACMAAPEAFAPGPKRSEAITLLRDMATYLGTEILIRQTRAMQRRRDYQTLLCQSKIPTLVLCGAQEGEATIKRHRFLGDLIPNAEVSVIEDAGRLPTFEQPDATIDVMQTWMGRPAPAR